MTVTVTQTLLGVDLMAAEGFFHDAHEVYGVTAQGEAWIATFTTKKLADGYARELNDPSLDIKNLNPPVYEVRPV